MSRRAIGSRLRYAILERDGYRCRYCGASANETKLHIDHRMPVARGGTNDPTNLVTACEKCNLGKHAELPTRHIPAQREHAFAAILFQRVCERYGEEVPFWRAFCIILDFCLSIEELDGLMKAALGASTWDAAEEAMYLHAGYPDANSYWSGE